MGEHRRDERQRGDEAEVARADGDERVSLQRRPRERPLGEDRQRQPEAGPADGEREQRQNPAAAWQEGERREPERHEHAPGEDRDVVAGRPNQPAGDEAAERKGADDRGAANRRVAPAGDQEQYGEEERADERAEQQADRHVRQQMRGAVVITGRFGPAGNEQRPEPQRSDGDLHDEDRPPVEHLGQDAAERGADCHADAGGAGPRLDRLRARARQSLEHTDGAGEQDGAAHPLDDACRDQERQAVRSRARGGGRQEDHDPGSVEHTAREVPAERKHGQGGHGDRQVVGRQHPAHADYRGREVAVQLRERERDDGRVCRGGGDRDRHAGREGGAPAQHARSVRLSGGSARPGASGRASPAAPPSPHRRACR